MHFKNKTFYLALFCLVVVALMNTAFSFLTKYLVDALTEQDLGAFYTFVLALCGTTVLLLLCEYGQQRFSQQYSNEMGEILHQRVLRQLLQEKGTRLEAEFVSRVSNDIEAVKELYYENQLSLMQGIFSFLFALVAIFSLDFITAGFILVLSLMPIAIPYLLKDRLALLQDRISDSKAAYLVELTDFIEGLVVIKNSFSLPIFRKKLVQRYQQVSRDIDTKTRLSSLGNVLVGLSFYATTILILWIGGWQVLNGKITLGTIVAIYSISSELVSPINLIASALADIKSSKGLLAKLLQGAAEDEADALPASADFQTLEIAPLTYVLDEERSLLFPKKALVIQKGQKYQVLGKNGSGKSTLLEILTKNKEYSKGSVTIDGQELQTKSYQDVQALFAYVPQKSVLFHDSFLHNITLYQEYDEAEIMFLIHELGLAERFPDFSSLNELVSKDNHLSGGQEQKLALLRAILQKKPILLMDESLSAVDEASYQQIEQFLLAQSDMTILHVTHRPSSARYDGVMGV